MSKPRVAWSFSVLDMFENCPRKHHAVKIEKSVSDANKWNMKGDDEHKCFDAYLKGKSPLPSSLTRFTPMLDAVRASPGQMYSEYQMALTQDYVPCGFKDWDKAWVRAISDVAIVNGPKAKVLDWKTGKPKDDDRQMALNAAVTFQHFPAVNHIDTALVFVHHNTTIRHVFTRADVPQLWNRFLPGVKRLELAAINNDYPATPNPLCRYCPVVKCPHNENKDAR